jgi:3'(2'), 5'-bisphosphate nucleotidase
MKYQKITKKFINQIINVSLDAGKEIMKIYETDFEYQIKDDDSPITTADQASHKLILTKLKKLTPHIPILSEEDANIPLNIRSKWHEYWLVDPLDGTKEFIKRNGEFTVNIALVRDNKPVIGIIYVPAINETFWGALNYGSFHIKGDNKEKKINVNKVNKRLIKIVTSSSHPSKMLNHFLKKIDNYQIITKGSSLKLCLVASGKAHIYPRFGPTSEWDIAAGEAIVNFAGGNIVNLDGKPLTYNLKESFLNPEFLCTSSDNLKEKLLSLLD